MIDQIAVFVNHVGIEFQIVFALGQSKLVVRHKNVQILVNRVVVTGFERSVNRDATVPAGVFFAGRFLRP